MKLTTKILLGLVAGIVFGLLLGGMPHIADSYIAPLGALFLNLVRMLIIPLVFSSIIVGTASMNDIKKIGRIGGKTIAFYMGTTAIAATIGIFMANLIKPGAGLTLSLTTAPEVTEIPALSETLLNMIPANPLKGLVEGNMLQIIIFAIFLGISATAVKEKSRVFLSFFDGLAETMYTLTAFIMKLAPYGVFALIAPVVANNGPGVLLPLGKVILAVYLGVLLHSVLVYSTIVSCFGRISPIQFFRGILPVATVAFSTSSSVGTLPVTIKAVKENLGVPGGIASFVLPLGATINMDGTGLYQGVCALFVAQIAGIDLSLSQQVIIVLTATLSSIGTAGVPGAGLIMLTMVLTSVGLPLEGAAMIAGVDRILDMARTFANVVGDGAVAVAVSATERKGTILPYKKRKK